MRHFYVFCHKSDGTVEEMPSFEVTPDMEGQQSYRCVVYNTINDQEYSAFEIFNFTVQSKCDDIFISILNVYFD